MRRIFVWLMVVCLVVLPLGGTVLAAQEELEQRIIDSCTYNKKISVKEYELTQKQLGELYYELLYDGKLPWYVSYEYTYYYNEHTDMMLDFEPILLDESYDRMTYEQEVAGILDACILEGMADWQKALAIHDYLAIRGCYDESYELDTGYDLLVNGTAVCSGYAALYQDLMLRLGIPCVQVDSEGMDHVWNLVQLEGNWYHVDVTWGDPTPNVQGMVDHNYFLRTDEEMRKGKDMHFGWETDIVCDDETYSDAFWLEVCSPILFTDPDTCYYLRSKDCTNSLFMRSVSQNRETAIYREKETYVDIGSGKYAYSHTGLTLREGRLWLCDMEKVWSIDLSGKNKKLEYTYDTKKNNRYLGGFQPVGDTLYLTVRDHDGDCEDAQVTIVPVPEHQHSFTRTVTAATCAAPGYTTAVCDCGLTATGDPKAKLEHSWKVQDHEDASIFGPGYTHSQCTVCGEKETLVLSQLTFGEFFKEYGIVMIALVSIPISILIRKSKWKK